MGSLPTQSCDSKLSSDHLQFRLEQHSAANEELINNWLIPPAVRNILKCSLYGICAIISQEGILTLLPFYRAKKAALIKYIIEIHPSFHTKKLRNFCTVCPKYLLYPTVIAVPPNKFQADT